MKTACFGAVLTLAGFIFLTLSPVASFILLGWICGIFGAFLISVGSELHIEGRLVESDLHLKKNDIYEVVGVISYCGKFITIIRDRKGKIRAHQFDTEPPAIFKFVNGRMVEYPVRETQSKGPGEVREIA